MRRFVWGAVVTAGMLALWTGSVEPGVEAAEPQTQTAPKAAEPRATNPARPLVNLNTATSADLQKLPGIGPRLAERILQYRQKQGGFKKIEELMNVQGIGEKNFLKLKPLITVSPVRPERGGSQ